MDWYSIVKFLHVVTAILWVGGGFVLFLLGMLAERAGNIEESCRRSVPADNWAAGFSHRCRC